jgi:hypothetical protein
MAKSETPAEVSVRPHRPAAGIRPDPSLASPVSPERLRGGRELADAPGLAKARERRSELASDLADTTRSTLFPDSFDADLLGEDDVIDEELAASAEDEFVAARFGVPRVGGARVPIANLEPPSSARVELTPSPVPRVSLAPATGAVDISLVPGPSAGFSRNLPTLAAQHVLGRRQQRRPAAAAVTVPPTTDETARESRVSTVLPKEVRSSKREVVLGLTIGLGLSLLLAAVGQAYLRDDVIASGPDGVIESITLSARPEAATASAASSSAASSSAASAGAPSGTAASAAEPVPTSPAAGVRSADSKRLASAPHVRQAPSGAGDARLARGAADGDESALLAHARLEPQKRTSEKAERAERMPPRPSARERAARRASPITSEPPVFEVERPLSEAPHERAPLSPAESAGLGLDLPL